ncbi:MAG: hypothetical protein Tsb0018_02790 [Opitutales bacterium]
MLYPLNGLGQSQREALYLWPNQKRPTIQAQHETVDFDGMEFEQLTLKQGDLKISMPPLMQWTITTPTDKDSLRLVYTNYPSLILTFSIFKQNEFLPDIEDETLKGYVAGLKELDRGNIKILNEGNFTPYKSFPIAGASYKVVEYEIETQENETFLAKDYLLFPSDELLIIHVQGPPKAVMRAIPVIDASLQQSFLDDE